MTACWWSLVEGEGEAKTLAIGLSSGWGADDETIKANYRQERAMDRRRCSSLAAVG
jgi:hypothetical protein